MNGIDVTENQSLFFQAEDKDGKILAKNSISIYGIGKLKPDLFSVSFNFFSSPSMFQSVEAVPHLSSAQSPYYDIYYKIITKNDFDITSNTGHISRDYASVNNNATMHFQGVSGTSFTLCFELRNKVGGTVALTKTYDITLKLTSVAEGGFLGGDSNSGVTGGTVNGENDPNIADDYKTYEKMSLDELIDFAKGSFNTFKSAFSILPGFVWGMLVILLGVVIALRILGR